MNKRYCPSCGLELKKKVVKKGRKCGKSYRRTFTSYICKDCGYAEYDSGTRERAITDGKLDNELDILTFED